LAKQYYDYIEHFGLLGLFPAYFTTPFLFSQITLITIRIYI